ncbi:hypothetical protein EYF80_041197 [Liparis tanakae]|uniref:Uncharacterized protein n=1 Tax=Liparis tanakae TaxID=230148 RepID=A0A4Z2G638_9TELE|nr:hypothetical protein EYF80_041197 [Liparis tanakae]
MGNRKKGELHFGRCLQSKASVSSRSAEPQPINTSDLQQSPSHFWLQKLVPWYRGLMLLLVVHQAPCRDHKTLG